MPYLQEAVPLDAQGLALERIDQTMRRFGMPRGPLGLLDQSGLDVAAQVAKAVQPNALAGFDLTGAFAKLVEKGWLGQKAGLGFYRYRGKKKAANAAAAALLESRTIEDKVLLKSLPPAAQTTVARDRL